MTAEFFAANRKRFLEKLEENSVVVYLTNAETRKFPTGEYRWD